MNFPTGSVKIQPLLVESATISTSLTCKTRFMGQGDFDVLCYARAGTVATGLTATVAGGYGFTVQESSDATAAGSNISGATLNLGNATAFEVNGAVRLIVQVGTACDTGHSIVLNGITYRTTAVGATAMNGGMKLCRAINGKGTSQKLPHYRAFPEYTTGYVQKDLILIEPDDDYGTGLTAQCTAGSSIVIYQRELQGVIHVSAAKLSTVSPKFIGVTCTPLTGLATGAHGAFLVTHKTGGGFVGRETWCTTGTGG
jgi:hypothetical protein